MTTSTNLNYVVHSAIFLSLFSLGLTIECFQCNSVEHPGCEDLKVNDTKSQYYKKCDGDYQKQEPFCRKVETEIMNVEDSARIYRSCGWIRTGNFTMKDFCRKADTDFIKKRQCQCYSNACNVSDRITPSSASVIILAILLNVFRQLGLI
ncbi:uncharacterized protein LOC108903963 [Anoplophora glabripennis]|uniref:uncharacterized protein LOC108903963 n=1 Tax=Anoplophora glabripennis TaxID=217634 RepID=UPI000873D112|nr:uncharacterized protein LOC108903963 [Anoplophora glabripennis]